MQLFDKDFVSELDPYVDSVRPFRVRNRSRADSVLGNIARDKAFIIEDKRFAALLLDSDLDFDTEPASIYEASKLQASILKYFTGVKDVEDNSQFNLDIYFEALTDVYNAFKPKRKIYSLDRRNYASVISALQKDTSSGYPFFKRKDESYEYAFDRVDKVLSYLKAPNPATSFFRTQRIAGENSQSKVRLVWGFPLEMTIIEALYARPLIDYYLEFQVHPIAFGLTKLQLSGRMTNILNCQWQYSLDYSQFDSRIHSDLLNRLFDMLFSWVEDVNDDAYRIKERIKTFFIKTPLLTPWGLILGKKSGIPSGSYFTQLIGSMVNYFLLCYLIRKNNLTPHRENINVLGDDSVFGTNVPLKYFSQLQDELRVVINLKKSQITEFGNKVHFLGRYYTTGLPHGDPKESRTKLVFPERNRNIEKDDVKLVVASYLNEYVENAQWINPLLMHGADLSYYLYYNFFKDKELIDVEQAEGIIDRFGSKANKGVSLHANRISRLMIPHSLLA